MQRVQAARVLVADPGEVHRRLHCVALCPDAGEGREACRRCSGLFEMGRPLLRVDALGWDSSNKGMVFRSSP